MDYQCQNCELKFTNLLRRKIHEQQVHVFIHQCNFCLIKFKTNDELIDHIDKSHVVKKEKDESLDLEIKTSDSFKSIEVFECTLCEDLFRNDDELNNHIKLLHPQTVVAVECHICEELFRSDSDLKEHTETTHVVCTDKKSDQNIVSNTEPDDKKVGQERNLYESNVIKIIR